MTSELIEKKLALLPNEPGSYQMKNADGKIIYVGKAKNLKNRVRSYFKVEHTGKTAELVKSIADFDFIVTSSDKEAFLLEITLIQKWQPYYNIRLKQGTGYPYIKITAEKDPQLVLVSEVKKDNGIYFGPYPNVYAAQETLHLLQKVYPLRRCNGFQGRPCLYYHMGQCLGACFKEVSNEKYQKQINKIRSFLNGNTQQITKKLTADMYIAANEMEYERAGEIRDQLKFIDTTVEKQKIIMHDNIDRDIINFTEDQGWLSVQIFFIRQARLMKREKQIFTYVDSAIDTMNNFIIQFYRRKNLTLPKEILITNKLDKELLSTVLQLNFKTPQKGIKKQLLDLAAKNAQIALAEKLKLMLDDSKKTTGAVQSLSDLLAIPYAQNIEIFDHSHIQGSDLVSAMVTFVDGKAANNLYRKYKLKTVNHADEYQATQEVVRRRYTRLLKEHKKMPDLILLDGGTIQLTAAKDVLENELNLKIPIAAMVKNDQHKTAGLIQNTQVKELDKHSGVFHLLERMQEEVHRFAISFHRQVHSKKALASRLDEIRGVGPKTRQKLLVKFGSINKIAQASLTEIKALGISETTAQQIKLSLEAIMKAEKLKK
ncbi:excinuclease ABC subunit UvrC [Periweissella beninensis]|uniref:UvrABC system protein C n=1 Tax=Periweissella beninensis TaxID=504936 RepID=A0ABT0VID6_9LACO|nr:excinuclease ABC subunit UvrC [Periweissella beninensis]MBM7544199.1 excinuclease ABC subunit C [Periweissella beninensis]MCM2437593.1 excinuclease ABC subunit UvrC [Periweissella beninensis]MCT4396628.1 excinuclease ABC subunit UvrC [Periweissella beninensis]